MACRRRRGTGLEPRSPPESGRPWSALPAVKAWMHRQERKRGKRKALSILEAKIGRTVYHLWRKQVPFDTKRFFTA
jgi:hypothetical protein